MSCSDLLYLLVIEIFILHAVAIEGFCVRWPLKVARLEVAKAWPLGARGCSLLGLCPLIELQWGRRRPPLTSHPADQELFQLTCNYSEGMRQSSVHQFSSKVCDTNASIDSSCWSLNRMWKCWQGLNCRPGMTKPMICWSLFVRPLYQRRHYETRWWLYPLFIWRGCTKGGDLLRIPRYQVSGGGVSQLRRYFISLAPPVDWDKV